MAIIILSKGNNITTAVFGLVQWLMEGAGDEDLRPTFAGLMGNMEKRGKETLVRLTSTNGKQLRSILLDQPALPPELVEAVQADAERDQTKLFSFPGKATKDTIILGDHEAQAVQWQRVYISPDGKSGWDGEISAKVHGLLRVESRHKDKVHEALRACDLGYAILDATGKRFNTHYLAALQEGRWKVLSRGTSVSLHLEEVDRKALSPAIHEVSMVIAAMNDENASKVEPVEEDKKPEAKAVPQTVQPS